MGATKLRYASEGPFVQNEDGGFAKPGEGFQTRRVMVSSASPAEFGSAPVPITSTYLALDNVQLGMRYRAAAELHIQKTEFWTATGTATFSAQYSANEGANWTTFFTQAITYGGTSAHDWDDQADVYMQTVPVLGSALTGVVEGSSIEVRWLQVVTGGPTNIGDRLVYAGSPSYVASLIEEL